MPLFIKIEAAYAHYSPAPFHKRTYCYEVLSTASLQSLEFLRKISREHLKMDVSRTVQHLTDIPICSCFESLH